MAETYKKGSDTEIDPEIAPETGSDKQSGFHYYSGGQIKELEHTPLSPALIALYTVVIVGAIGYLFFGGALGPNGPFGIKGAFKPAGGSKEVQREIHQAMMTKANGGATMKEADMVRLVPIIQTYAPNQTLDQSISNGSEIYQAKCIGCHGPNQDGNGVSAATLNPKPRNLHDSPFMRQTLDYKRINNSLHYGVHGTAMPAWSPTLTELEIQEVISYVLSLTWTMPGDTATPPATSTPSTPAGPNGSGGVVPAGTTPNSPIQAAPAGEGVKSPTGSVTGGAGGVTVHGGGGGQGSVSSSPRPITPTINGNPAAATSTAPPSQSGQPAAATPIDPNTPAAGDTATVPVANDSRRGTRPPPNSPRAAPGTVAPPR